MKLLTSEVISFFNLYDKIMKLEKEGKKIIWTRLLKNSFAPLLMGKIDFVVGNLPWVNWESLPEYYREDTKKLWGKKRPFFSVSEPICKVEPCNSCRLLHTRLSRNVKLGCFSDTKFIKL